MDWWTPAGEPGEIGVAESVGPHALDRILATGDGAPLQVSAFTLAGAAVRVVVEQGRLAAYDEEGGELATLALPPGAGSVLGLPLTLSLREDAERGSRLHGPKREWVATDGAHTWVWDTRKPAMFHPRLLVDSVETVTVESGPLENGDEQRLVKKRLRHLWAPTARPVDVLLNVLFLHADLRQALHGRVGRGIRTAFSVAGVVLDLADEDHVVTSRARCRVSRSPGAGPPPGPPGPSSGR